MRENGVESSPLVGAGGAITLDEYLAHREEQELRERERRGCRWALRRNPGLVALALLLCVAGALGATVFRDWVVAHHRELLKFGSIPLVSVVFTYFHIYLALQMTFYPVEFIGCCDPFCGWQGIIPRKAGVMAAKAVDLMTSKLLRLEDMFARLDPARVAAILGPTLRKLLESLMPEVAMDHFPDFWRSLDARVKREIMVKALEDSGDCIAAIMQDVQANIERVFDLKAMVVGALVENKALLNELFLKCGEKEFRYIKVLGAKIGFLFGLAQMAVWLYYRAMWVLPVTGFLVGYLTNWLALKMIFQPVEPVRLCGGYVVIHGLFLKRQLEVSAVYARLVTTKVLTGQALVESMVLGPYCERLFVLIDSHVQAAVESYAGRSAPLLSLALGRGAFEASKRAVVERVMAEVPGHLAQLQGYIEEAMDMERTIFLKMAALPFEDFERLLHPVFEEDEWKLIILGGLLGVAVGVAQFYMLGG